MAVDPTVVATGAFTLAAALGGAALSTGSTLIMGRRSDQRQDKVDLRRERIRIYARFLTAVSSLETAADYLGSVLQRQAKAEMADAHSWAASARDRAAHALSELELFAGDEVSPSARSLHLLAQEHYRLRREGKDGISITEARTAATNAMKVELGISKL